MASSSPPIILYASSAATYVCEAGDVQPTYPFLQPFTEELLRTLPSPQAAAASSPLGDRSASPTNQCTATLRRHLLPLLHDRTLFLVLPLSSSASYKEEWVRFCFHEEVHVRRLVVLSDTVADSFACNRTPCVVLHASLNTVSVSRVESGCSTRYGNSHVGGVQALCSGGEATTARLAERLPAVAAAMAIHNAERASGSDEENEEEGEDEDYVPAGGPSPDEELGIDFSDAKYRDALIHAFGYRAYRSVIVAPQQRRLDAASRSSVKGKGKGKGGGRAQRRSRASCPLLDELRRAYPREVREAPGQLEKLLARVVQGDAVASSSHGETEPCILAGEALAVPYVRQLYAFVIRRCGGGVWEAVEMERRARQRRLRSSQGERGNADGSGAPPQESDAAPVDPEKSSSVPMVKRVRRETSSERDSGSDEGESDDESDDDGDVWLHLQPIPLPSAPWWLPLLGASVTSRLPDKDLQRAVITEEEARESNGTVVHWKVLL